jgi:predicted PurR-regulated permease PerM
MNIRISSPDTPTSKSPPGRTTVTILTAIAVLAVLYFARDVLVPIALAIVLSLALAPVVRWLRRAGFGHTSSVISAVTVAMCVLGAVAIVIVSQLGRAASSLPHYEKTIELKVQGLEQLTHGSISVLTGEAERELRRLSNEPAAATDETTPGDARASQPGAGLTQAAPSDAAPIPVQVLPPPRTAWGVIQTIAASVWVPLQTAGIVLVVLLFVLLEHEALRDRLIKVVGSADLRLTTLALNDAGVRLSRFFATQFLINIAVGALIGLGLAAIGVPHALVWGTLTFVLRFIPYVGIWIAALLATLLAAAIVPGWTLAALTLAMFVILDLIAGQVVEPHLYGHTTGLSPLSVVIAAIFWSWLWGPIGLVISTPLTVCLVVAGRYTPALYLLDVLLGDAPALTMPQRFYQRALSGDSQEVISSARLYLRRSTLASYCDLVLVPALQLAGWDFDAGLISQDQASKIRRTVMNLIISLDTGPVKRRRRHMKPSLLEETNIGRALRNEREAREGRWQGPLAVPPGSVVLGVALASVNDELAAELLVRILRAHGMDARSVLSTDLDAPAPPGASPASVSTCFLVSTNFDESRSTFAHTVAVIRNRFPESVLVTLFFPAVLPTMRADEPLTADDKSPIAAAVIDREAHSYVESLQISLEIRTLKEEMTSSASTGV